MLAFIFRRTSTAYYGAELIDKKKPTPKSEFMFNQGFGFLDIEVAKIRIPFLNQKYGTD